MKIWAMLFTDSASPLASLRIAAPDLDAARALAIQAGADPDGEGAIILYAGETDGAAGVLRRQRRSPRHEAWGAP